MSNLPSTNVRFIRKNGRVIPIFQKAGAAARKAKNAVGRAVRTATNEAGFAARKVKYSYVNGTPRIVKQGIGVAAGLAVAGAAGYGIKKAWGNPKTEGEKKQRQSIAIGAAVGTTLGGLEVAAAAKNPFFRRALKRMPVAKQVAAVGTVFGINAGFWTGLGVVDGAIAKRAADKKKGSKK